MKIRLMHPAVGEIAFPLRPGGSLVVGRLGAATDVEIHWDPRISRRHCRLWEKDGRVWFQDLASRNGSWIGNERVAGVVRLTPGAFVLIGETILILPEELTEESYVEETHERPLTEAETQALIEKAETHPVTARIDTTHLGLDLGPPQAESPLPTPEPSRGTAVPTRRPSGEIDPLTPEPSRGVTIPTRRPPAETIPPPLGPSRGSAVPTRRPPAETAPVDTKPKPTNATADLRDSRFDTPLAESTSDDPSVVRTSPRFIDSRRVKVRARGREDLRDLWMRDISKGGLFVETRSPPAPDTQLEVQLETPEGVIQLQAVVVHVLTEEMATSFGGQSGVGVQFIDLDPATRDAIQAYIEGVADQLKGGSSDLNRMPASESDALLQLAKQFLQDAEKRDFYEALGLRPTASYQSIIETAVSLQQRLSEATHRVPPTLAARLKAALNVLGRVRRVLTHEQGRLEYDFRNGHIRAGERIKAAKAGQAASLATLRQAWNRVFPERVDRAALLTRKAFAARQRQDLAAAIDAGRSALELNPFFEELKQTVEVWETSVDV